jgi:hypothetical protein
MIKRFLQLYQDKYFRFFYIRIVYLGIGFCLGLIFTTNYIEDGIKYFSLGF